MADAQSARDQVTLDHADVSLFGELTEERGRDFLEQLRGLRPDGADAVVEVTTIGGDAEVARRLVLEIELVRKRLHRRLVFVGKTQVYSAGITLMAAFPRADRYLSRDCVILIHCRQLDKTIEISGPMRSSLLQVKALVEQIETGLKLEEEGFRRLLQESDIALDELLGKAVYNWYLTAEEAQRRRLVAGLL